MDTNFQRRGSRSNTHAGEEFELQVKAFFQRQGIQLAKSVSIPIGVNKNKKLHKFDLGSKAQRILVECKSHTWTESENVPSAKITTWDQAMFYFYACPADYRKIFMVLRDYSKKKGETLCEYYLRTKAHMIPDDVEIWEYDTSRSNAVRLK